MGGICSEVEFLQSWMHVLNCLPRLSLRPLSLARRSSAVAKPLPHPILDLYPDHDSLLPDPSLDESQLNDELHSLVLSGQFSAAERLRLKIIANGLHVNPRPEYAHVALACLRNRRLSGASGHKLDEYLTWLNLVPDREHLRSLLSSHSRLTPTTSPFDQIVHEITYRTSAPKFRPFLSHTGLVIASKGFAKRHFLTLARPIILQSPPTSPCLSALVQMERHAAKYERLHERPPTPIAREIRCSLIQLFAQRGWPWKSIDLILARRTYALPDSMYQVVLDGIHDTRQTHKKDQILKRWEKDKTRCLYGIKR